MFRFGVWLIAVLAISGAAAAQAQQISLSIDDLEAPAFSAKALKASLNDIGRALLLEIGEVTLRGRTWRNVRVQCPRLRLESSLIECADAVMDAGEKIPLSFSYSWRQKTLDVALQPAANETWRLHAGFAKPHNEFQVVIDNGKAERLASWLPAGMPGPAAGAIKGTIVFSDAGVVGAQIEVNGLAFSDASGLHAGDKIKATFSINAEQRGAEWRWQGRIDWIAGEVFWQPLYVTGAGQQLIAEGASDAARTHVRRGQLKLQGTGDIGFEGQWDRKAGEIVVAGIRSSRLRLGPLYTQILKPFLETTALNSLRAEGEAEISLQIGQGKLNAVDVQLAGMSLEDQNRRFGLFGVGGHIPWRRDATTVADISIKGGEILRLPFGSFRLPLRMAGLDFSVDKLSVPLLDGALTVNDFTAGSTPEGWRWSFSGGVTPISVTRFTQSLGLPTMHGTLSAVIPKVSYARSTLNVDGALLFRVFDGTIVAKDVSLFDPFGKASRVYADLDMSNLDLNLLTNTFSFGNITGRLDIRVADLELANWQPVKFDARVASSAGEYPRKISQAAVQNISALGGAGAAAAIQRSFLRFFEQFGYEKLGLSCRLRNNICEMGGVEDAPQGYVIVKGGGIPAISVIGYNRYVSWQELIDRLKRIMQQNVRAIVE